EDRIQDDLEAEQSARREDACRERDQRGVVEERPEEVLSDLLHRPAAQLDRGDDVTQIVLDQHDPAGLHRDVRAAAEGDPDVRLGEGRGVVDPIPYHRDDLARGLQLLDLLGLLRRQHFRDHAIDARLPRPGIASAPPPSRTGALRSAASRTIAWPNGCSEPVSADAAMRSNSSGVYRPKGMTSVTEGVPFVSVPVLSKTTVVRRCAFSRYSPPLMRRPFSAPLPVPTMIAAGVAMPRAHGQAMISTAMKKTRAWA